MGIVLPFNIFKPSHLTKLHARGSHHEFVTDIKGTLPHVEYMLIWDKSPILASFTFPNIRYLSLNEAMDMWDRIDEPLTFYPGTWSNLVSLDVAGHKVDWCDMSLPSVEKIVVGAYSPSEKKPDNSLITDLASRLDILPSLNHIGFRFIPEFDLLFIMLERRNFGTNTGITPIATISLPSRLIDPILKPLTSRLGKKLTKRPSNFDLSSTSIASAFFDHNL